MDNSDKSIPEASAVLCNGRESNSKVDVIIIDDTADSEAHNLEKHVANTTNQDNEQHIKTAIDPTAVGNENEHEQSTNSVEKKHEQEDTNPVQTNKTIIEKDLYTSPELEKYWKAVKDNPADFTGWTYLLQFVEQEHNLDAAREAYDAFLARYPYCYGYWKKYADMEKKHDHFDEAEEIFERGVKAIPLSIDLWVHYINFLTLKYTTKAMLDMKKRQLFDRAITAAGTDFRSDKLWEMYINWERQNGNMRNVCALYDRLIKIPTQLYSHQYESFAKLIKEYHPKKLLSLDEFLQIRREVIKPTSQGHCIEEDIASSEIEAMAPPGCDDLPPGEEPPPPVQTVAEIPRPLDVKVPPGVGKPEKADTKEEDEKFFDEDEIPSIQERILQRRHDTHEQTEAEVSKRWNFEDRIRRPYFHVKPLEKAQLRNWREYLEFEMSQGLHERIVVLFERCLIACALYEEFWLKYADYMMEHSIDGVRNVFRRSCEVHLPKKPSIHLAWAAFEEKQGKYLQVEKIFNKLEKEVPGLVMTSLRRISVERRQGNFERTSEMYEKCIDDATDNNERAFYVIKYARHLAKVIGDSEKAKQVLEKALQKDMSNAKLLLQLIDVAYTRSPIDENEMVACFDRGIDSDLAIEHRVAFSQRKMEFLEDFGSSVVKLTQSYEDHQKLLKDLQSKKRKATPDPAETAKRQKLGPAPSAASAAPATSAVTTAATTATAATSASTDYSQVSSTTDGSAYSQAAYGYNYNYQNYYGWPGYGQHGYYQT